MISEKYQTKPLETWKIAKEIRKDYLYDVEHAHERGKLLVNVMAENMFSLWSGFTNCEMYWATGYTQDLILHHPEMNRECFEIREAHGYRDVCNWIMAPFGEMLHPASKIKLDMVVTHHVCEPMVKCTQVLGEQFGIPTFVVDVPRVPPEQLRDSHFDYLLAQLHDGIRWMEKTTGTRCNDEALIEGIRNEWETEVLIARILELNKAVPAPLDLRTFAALTFPAFVCASKGRTVMYFRELLDEVKYRVKNQIAALATERCRLFHESAPPFPFIDLLKSGHKYGAVFVGGSSIFMFPPALRLDENGSLKAAQTLEEQGIVLKTRDDALRALANLHLYNTPVGAWMSVIPRAKIMAQAVQDWHIDGVVFSMDHGCQGMPAGLREVELKIKEMGIPTMAYECDSVDGRSYSVSTLMDSFEGFFENMGLDIIED